MNIFALIILVTLLFDYIISLIADVLNIKALKPDLPSEFRDVYDAETYTKSQEYTRINTHFGVLVATLSLALTLVFWFAGGFRYVDQLVRGVGWSPIGTGLLFIALLMFLKSLFSLPFAVYDTFVIEERFGFNRTTWKTFVLDLIKGLLLAIVIGGPLLAGVLAFFQFAGNWAWFYCWLGTTLFSLILQYIAPTWIMPLFNKFKPIQEGELRQRILEMAEKARFPLKDVLIMDGSRRSAKSNAFFTGFGKNKRIALYDTLVEKHTVPELVSVLAHEIGHYKKKHILQNLLIGIVHNGVLFFLLSIFLNQKGLFDAFYVEQPSIYAGLVFFGMLYSPIEMVIGLFLQIKTRWHEYQADRFAVSLMQESDSLISALKKLTADNLMNLTPHPFYVFLNYSHPPVLQRIRVIRTLPPNP